MQIFERFSSLFFKNSYSNIFFLKFSKDLPTKMYEDLKKDLGLGLKKNAFMDLTIKVN